MEKIKNIFIAVPSIQVQRAADAKLMSCAPQRSKWKIIPKENQKHRRTKKNQSCKTPFRKIKHLKNAYKGIGIVNYEG
ncbi:MAG: hypothetical protein KGO82_18120 [Bacteroidota bacterium]|nr:hypothetical protein [Bacteroidota bacterium]